MRPTTNEIAECVRRSLERYFKDLDGAKPAAIYDMVLRDVEKPLHLGEGVQAVRPGAKRGRRAWRKGIVSCAR